MSYQEKIYTEKQMSLQEGMQKGEETIIDKMRKSGMSESQIQKVLNS